MHPFLTIIRWPDGQTPADVADLLVREVGFDPATARLRSAAPPPFVWGRVPADRAAAAIACMTTHGGDAFAPTMADLEALGATRKIRDIRITGSGLHFELWREPAVTIDPSSLGIIVRGHMSEQLGLKRTSAPTPGTAAVGEILGQAAGSVAWGAGGSYGWAIGLHAAASYRDRAERDRRVRASFKLDLHAADGAVYQVDGDKFGFGILGDLRGHTDKVNIDRMCELFVHLVPDAIVDVFFELFRPPAGYDRLRLPRMAINRDDPAFAFYSRWSALVYRHVLG